MALVLQTYVEKGNDLIEEAAMLAQSEAFSESALGYRDTARLLKKQLQLFSSQLEDTHERIEGTARCYSLLDKVGIVVLVFWIRWVSLC